MAAGQLQKSTSESQKSPNRSCWRRQNGLTGCDGISAGGDINHRVNLATRRDTNKVWRICRLRAPPVARLRNSTCRHVSSLKRCTVGRLLNWLACCCCCCQARAVWLLASAGPSGGPASRLPRNCRGAGSLMALELPSLAAPVRVLGSERFKSRPPRA